MAFRARVRLLVDVGVRRVGAGGGSNMSSLTGSRELWVSARHVSGETGAHLQSPRVQKGNLFTGCG